jgi:preprotein translocase subunit SecD
MFLVISIPSLRKTEFYAPNVPTANKTGVAQ